MKIDSSIPPIGPNVSSLKDSVQIQAENRQVVQAVRAVNASVKLGVNDLTFSLDRYTRRPVVKLVNRQTNETVAQIPNEEVLRLAQDLKTG
jgi:flagellar protein FlaG